MDIKMAPVVLFAYKRLDHLKKTIQSLEKNAGADCTELFIFSDAAAGPDDREDVDRTRDFLAAYEERSVFLSYKLIISDKHKGLARSVIAGTSEIINKYGKVIVVEDDLEFSPLFLEYMNAALNHFENDDRIWSVSGYTPNLGVLRELESFYFLNYRPYSWGWATWKDRWEKVDWNVSEYRIDRFNPLYYYKMSRGGNLLPSMLRAQMNGKLDSWYVRWCYYANRYNMLTVYSSESFVRNIGFDSTGTHCHDDISDKYDVKIASAPKQFLFEHCEVNKEINRSFRRFHSMRLIDRIHEKFVKR